MLKVACTKQKNSLFVEVPYIEFGYCKYVFISIIDSQNTRKSCVIWNLVSLLFELKTRL